MNLQSPLGRVLGSGSAKTGTDHWWIQRVTAVALLLLASWFVASLTLLDDFSHAAVTAWASAPTNGVLLLLLSVTLAWHSALGIQVVLEDYVHGPFIKLVFLIGNKFVHVFLAIVAVVAVLQLVLGGSQ